MLKKCLLFLNLTFMKCFSTTIKYCWMSLGDCPDAIMYGDTLSSCILSITLVGNWKVYKNIATMYIYIYMVHSIIGINTLLNLMSLVAAVPNAVFGELHGRKSKSNIAFSISVVHIVVKLGFSFSRFLTNLDCIQSHLSISAFDSMCGFRIIKSYRICQIHGNNY